MKTGLSLVDMAQEVQRQRETKRDFIGDTRKMRFSQLEGKAENKPLLEVEGFGAFPIKRRAHTQIANRLGIPQPFYDRLLDGTMKQGPKATRVMDHPPMPDLLTMTVNKLFNEEPERRLIRVLDSDCRAFLSDRYRTLDNYDCAEAVLPELQKVTDMEVISTQLTDEKFYIKAVFPRIQGEVKVGDIVQAGVVISNSEVGAGAVSVMPLLYSLWCLNGCTTAIGGRRKYHTGKAADASDDAREVFTDATKRLTDAAFWSQIKDLVRACTQQATFDRILGEIQATTGQRITGDPVKTVELTAKRFNLQETEKDSVLRHLIDGGDLTRYGLLNAVTRTSQDCDDYDRASDLERLGGRIIELPKTEWTALAEAA